MWLALFFQFLVAVHADDEFSNRINQNDLNSVKYIKCKTPRVPEGQCVPLTKCDFLIEEYRRENGFISFILTGDRCGYRFGVLHACCPEKVERKAISTPEPVIGFEPINTISAFGRRTTRDVFEDRDFRRTERPFRFSTSTTRRTSFRDDYEDYGSPSERPSRFSTSTTRRSTIRDFESDFKSTERPFRFSTSTTRRTNFRDDYEDNGSPSERPIRFSTSTTRRSTNRNPETDSRSTERSIQDGEGNDNGFQHSNMRLLAQDNCGPASMTNKVVGGIATEIGEFPWLSMLLYSDRSGRISNNCGGTLISSQYVLTAAHCIESPELKRRRLKLNRVRLGEWDLKSPTDCQGKICNNETTEIEVQETIVHPSYDETNAAKGYDIALIRLREKAKFGHFIKPVCLPFADTGKYEGKLVVAGWGKTSNSRNDPGSDVLQQVAVPMVDKETCLKFYKFYNGNNTEFIESQICAGGEKEKDSCQGDSGGPLMKSTIKQTQRWEIVGIVSFGPKTCGGEAQPGVYTKVSSFLNWILDNIKS